MSKLTIRTQYMAANILWKFPFIHTDTSPFSYEGNRPDLSQQAMILIHSSWVCLHFFMFLFPGTEERVPVGPGELFT